MNINRQFAGAASGARAPSRTLSDDFDCLPIAPLLAGARARGLAEAFEMLGIAAILLVAWLLSHHKRAIKLRLILWGLGLQLGFAILVLKTDNDGAKVLE